MTKVTTVKCPKCGDTIFSRARHDWRPCTCGAIYVDGGFDYVRIGGVAGKEVGTTEVGATKQELYNDWNGEVDKYGLIKGGKYTKLRHIRRK